jgi:hypothetical protein
MVIKIISEDTTVIFENDEIIRWTEAVEKFIEMLRGCGFHPYNFVYENGNVNGLDAYMTNGVDIDNDMFEVNPISDHD